MSAVFPVMGFLGTGAPFVADLNFVAQLVMGAALIAGVLLARKKQYRAHCICQTTVLLLNLVMIALVMWPSFHQMRPTVSKAIHKRYYAAATIHAGLGITAELLGLYIIMVTTTNILPQRLRFNLWKRWMRAEFVLWLFVLISGLGTYYVWYIAPLR